MSRFPDNIRELKAYFHAMTGRDGRFFSVRGFVGAKRTQGYHLGEEDIYGPGGAKDRDYSVQHPRDKAGLSDFAAAIDIGLTKPAMMGLTTWLEQEAKAGHLSGVVEFIGLHSDGKVYDWRRSNKWKKVGPRKNPKDSHNNHVHVSFRRDRIPGTDLIPLFEGFFGARPDPIPPDPADAEPGVEEPPDANDVLAQLAELEAEFDAYRADTQALRYAHSAADGDFEAKHPSGGNP